MQKDLRLKAWRCPFECKGGGKYYGSVGEAHRAVGQGHPGASAAHQVEALREAGEGQSRQFRGGGIDDFLQLAAHQSKLATSLSHQIHPTATKEGWSNGELGHQVVHGGRKEESTTAKTSNDNASGKPFP